MTFPPTLIVRHRKENRKKCTLTPLQRMRDIYFYNYPFTETLPPLDQYIMLDVEAKPLTEKDKDYGLLLIDCNWRHVTKMQASLPTIPIKRSLPSNVLTAYPRKQTDCPLPEQGLASIEALYIAYLLLGRQADFLLDEYYWKEDFLAKNSTLLSK